MNEGKATIDHVMDAIAKDTELEVFVFFGGCPVDLLSSFADESSIGDFDISIKGIEPKVMERYEAAVQGNGYVIRKARRQYIISRTVPVFTTYAAKGKTVIDANFMEDPKRVGLFNIDSLYLTFPDKKIVDLYGSLDGLADKVIIPIQPLVNESPYFLAGRFIYISAKYGISMVDMKNAGVAQAILKQMVDEPIDQRGEFNSFLSAVLKSTLRSHDRIAYLRELAEIGILMPRLSELEMAIKQIARYSNRQYVEKIGNPNELVNFFASYLSPPLKGEFLEKIKPLYERVWESDGRRLERIEYQ